MADLRALIETKMFSKSERTLEKVGIDTIPQDTALEHAVSFFFLYIFGISECFIKR